MLAAEEANKRLDTVRDQDWRAKAEKRIGKLPRHLRELAASFAAPQLPWGVRDNQAEEHRKRQLAAGRALDGLPESDRAAVMAALHPGPGAALARWWVEAQHRGRVFLPFADDDPKAADIVSKTLLLARDHEIKDPTILEQLVPLAGS